MSLAQRTAQYSRPRIAFDITQNIEEHITPRQRINWFLATSQFVLAEDSIPSGEMIELEYCRNLGVTTAILHDNSLPRSSWMTLDSDIHCNDFKCFCYEKSNVEQTVELAIKWAKERNEEKEKKFGKTQADWVEKNKVFGRPEVQKAMKMLKDSL